METSHPMRLLDASAAIIQHEDGRLLLQLRDSKPWIPCPDHWGLFGGSIDEGETPEDALRRELHEELELTVRDSTYFTRCVFDLGSRGLRPCERRIYVVPITAEDHSRLVLHEGAEMRLFALDDILSGLRMTPYDAFVVWLYANRDNFTN